MKIEEAILYCLATHNPLAKVALQPASFLANEAPAHASQAAHSPLAYASPYTSQHSGIARKPMTVRDV